MQFKHPGAVIDVAMTARAVIGRIRRRGGGVCAGLCLAWICAPAYAAHPLQTEDTGTQGSGNVEVENGLSWARTGGSRVFLYQPQLSWGADPAVDLIVQPAWTTVRDTDGHRSRGLGDTNLDAKWRFFGASPWSAAIRFGVTAPTHQHALGEPNGTVGSHALLVATFDRAPYALHLNAGLSHQPGGAGDRTRIAQWSAAGMWSATPRLVLTVDAGNQSSRDRQTRAWPGYGLLGAIYTLKPGLDADIGYLRSRQGVPATREWLLGLTYRFAP